MDEERLAALERTVARQRRALRWQWVAFAVVGAACLLGQAPGVPDVVTCHMLKVIGANGKPVAMIGEDTQDAANPATMFELSAPGDDSLSSMVMLQCSPRDARVMTQTKSFSTELSSGPKQAAVAALSGARRGIGDAQSVALQANDKSMSIHCGQQTVAAVP